MAFAYLIAGAAIGCAVTIVVRMMLDGAGESEPPTEVRCMWCAKASWADDAVGGHWECSALDGEPSFKGLEVPAHGYCHLGRVAR